MKALILAAGRGSRLGPYTDDRPKCMIPVAGETLLVRSLNNLKQAGFKEVVVVVGYLHEKIEQIINEHFPGDFCKTIYNTDYTRGSGSSFICAANELNDEIVILESDLLYDKRVLERLTASSGSSLARGIFNHGKKEVKLYLENGYIKRAGWGEPDDKEAHGDMVGFIKLSQQAAISLGELLLSTDPDQGKEINYEDFVFRMLSKFPFTAVDIEDLPWMEIDDAGDLETAEQEILPKIIA